MKYRLTAVALCIFLIFSSGCITLTAGNAEQSFSVLEDLIGKNF